MFCHGEMVKGVVIKYKDRQRKKCLKIKYEVWLCPRCGQAWKLDYKTGGKKVFWPRRRGVA